MESAPNRFFWKRCNCVTGIERLQMEQESLRGVRRRSRYDIIRYRSWSRCVLTVEIISKSSEFGHICAMKFYWTPLGVIGTHCWAQNIIQRLPSWKIPWGTKRACRSLTYPLPRGNNRNGGTTTRTSRGPRYRQDPKLTSLNHDRNSWRATDRSGHKIRFVMVGMHAISKRGWNRRMIGWSHAIAWRKSKP